MGSLQIPTVVASELNNDSTKPSYYITNTPGTVAVSCVYVWNESLGVWSNDTYYLKNTSVGYFGYIIKTQYQEQV